MPLRPEFGELDISARSRKTPGSAFRGTLIALGPVVRPGTIDSGSSAIAPERLC